ncbi:MAG: beta-barrel assembly-enhancing protease [Thiomicrorhabdus sp.]|nr:MAG: beta-barrel assembly-enhancing protease [Thiomicrorhabdus sp.]
MEYTKTLKIKVAFIFFALAISTSTVHAVELPELGSQDLVAYDVEREKNFGRAFTSALHTQYQLNYDPEVISYVRRIGHKIASQTGELRDFSFYVINNPSINAFAGPNGVIGIHTGLIQAVRSEDELASVIAHEIAHITQRHLSRQHLQNSSQGNLASFATILAAVLIGAYEPTAVMPTIMAGMSLNIEKQLKNSREHEAEADSAGITLLQKAGYNPRAMATFFDRLANSSQNHLYQLPEILLSHPVTDSRIAQAENRAQLMIRKPVTQQDNSLELIQHRLLQPKQITKDNNYLFTDLEIESRCYLQNLLAIKSNSHTPNYDCIKKITQEHPEQSLYTNLLLELIKQSDHVNGNLKLFALQQGSFQIALFPQNNATLIRYSELLLKLNKTNSAIELLVQYTKGRRYKYLIHKKLSEIYAKQQQFTQAYFYKAKSEFNIGNLKRTIHLLEQAENYNVSKNKIMSRQITLLSNISNNLLKAIEKPQ